QRLPQRDGVGQLARGGTEDVGRHRQGVAVLPVPRQERTDPRLRDQAHPGAVLGRQLAVPLVLPVHVLGRQGGDRAHIAWGRLLLDTRLAIHPRTVTLPVATPTDRRL